LFAPTLDVAHLTGLMINQVESKRLPSQVARVDVSVTLSGPLRSNQTSLFQNDTDGHGVDAASGSDLSRLVNSLSSRLGRDAVIGVMVGDDPLPENAYRMWPLTGNQRKTKKRSRDAASRRTAPAPQQVPSPGEANRRPLSLLVRPIPLLPAGRVAENRVAWCEHPLPDRFRLDAVVHRVVRCWGPERIETGWWNGPCIRRDYYRIETDRGSWWWIFRTLVPQSQRSASKQTSCWMLHGRFD
jgi:protein ImuB